jgi:uncharacterized membrane protein YraQ (UPF0718 family)
MDQMNLETIWPMAEKALRFFAFAFVELTLLFIGISFIVAVLQHYLTSQRVKSMLSGRNGRGYLVGAGLGALTPFCSCSTIPIAVGLIKAQAGFGPTMAFLFASPLVNPVLVTLFVATFGWQITAVYSTVALGLATLSGFVLDRFKFQRYIRQSAFGPQIAPSVQSVTVAKPHLQSTILASMPAEATAGGGGSGLASASPTVPSKWREMLLDAVGQFRSFLPYILMGVAIGALCHGFVPDTVVYRYAGPDNPLAVPIAAIIGVPLYVRASTMVPIGMSLIAKGMSLGAVMALIIGGAGASIPEMVMLKRLFKPPVLAAFVGVVFTMAVSAGLLLNLIS